MPSLAACSACFALVFLLTVARVLFPIAACFEKVERRLANIIEQ
jgi:hypothetical protein